MIKISDNKESAFNTIGICATKLLQKKIRRYILKEKCEGNYNLKEWY